VINNTPGAVGTVFDPQPDMAKKPARDVAMQKRLISSGD
jgi:hypothetical protein